MGNIPTVCVYMCVCVHRVQEFSNANSLGNGGNQVYVRYLPHIHTLGFILIIWLTIILFIPYYLRDWDTRLGEVAIIQRSQRSKRQIDLKCCVLQGFESSWDVLALILLFSRTPSMPHLLLQILGDPRVWIFSTTHLKSSPWVLGLLKFPPVY